MNTNSIRDWAEDDRPREKLLLKGKSALSNAELLAIIIRSGSREESAVDLSKRLLASVNGSLNELAKLSPKDLFKFRGMGVAKGLGLIAALELGMRKREAEIEEKQKITSSLDVFEFFQPNLANVAYEEFWVLLLNRANRIIKKINISQGGLSGTVADPRRIFKNALDNGAVSIILCHNHPSGNIKPSEADIKLTHKLVEAGTMLDIHVLDHVIVGDEKYFSFADEGMI